jgi:dienelactone hydrolase
MSHSRRPYCQDFFKFLCDPSPWGGARSLVSGVDFGYGDRTARAREEGEGERSAKVLLSVTMASNDSPCCPPGSWEGPLDVKGPSPAKGDKIKLGEDLTVYYTAPPSGVSSKLGVVVFHDVWGHLPRTLSICDVIAEQGGFHVVAPDCFRGKTKDDVDDVLAWLKSHPYEDNIANDIDLCLEHLQSKGVEQFGAMGFCWGGWVIAKSSSVGVPWKVGVSPHPSTAIEKRVFGRDEEAMLDRVSMPFLVLPGGNDPDNLKPGHPQVQKLESKGGKSILFENMVHGWTTRSDLTDPTIKAAVEKALVLSLEFLKEHLQ